jgi:hypothetical protein
MHQPIRPRPPAARPATRRLVPAAAVTALFLPSWTAAAASAATPAAAAGPQARPPAVVHARPQAHPAAPIEASGTGHAAAGRSVTLPRQGRLRPAPAGPTTATVVPYTARSVTATITASFDGLGGDDLASTGVSVATSGTRDVEVVDGRMSVYDASGGGVCSVSLARLLPQGNFFLFPQVRYDNVSNRFLLMSPDGNITESAPAAIELAVSDTSDPCGNWFAYHLTLHGDPFAPESCLRYPSLGQTRTAVLIALSNSGVCEGSDGSAVFAIPKDGLYAHVTLSFPVFQVSGLLGAAAMDTAGTPMASSSAAYFLQARAGSQTGDYVLYRMDGADTGVPTVHQLPSFVAPFVAPVPASQPGTSAKLALLNEGNIQVSPVWDGSRLWFTQTIDMNTDSTSGPAVAVRYGYISPAENTLRFAQVSHLPDSADFNPSIGIGVAPNGVDTVFLNWSTIDIAQGLPASPAAAVLLYDGGSLPAVQNTDRILATGLSTTHDENAAFYSAVSVDPTVTSGTCAVTTQQYWGASSGGHDFWRTRLAGMCGPAQVTVPSLNGDTAAAAQSALQDAFLATGPQDQTTACSPSLNGLVSSTSPDAATMVPLGSPVTLHICNANVTVPDVLGFDDTSAGQAITAAGLTVGRVSMVPNCTVARGDVVTQNPHDGTQALRGTAVDLTESTGRQPNGKLCVIN